MNTFAAILLISTAQHTTTEGNNPERTLINRDMHLYRIIFITIINFGVILLKCTAQQSKAQQKAIILSVREEYKSDLTHYYK
eukprot:8656206-Ditylum_brightwellii.AAC.1